MIRLSREAEPEIYDDDPPLRHGARERRLSTPSRARLDLDDDSADREHPRRLPARLHPATPSRAACGGHPKNIILLTADAFGVLPPIARLTPEQAMYHFLSGYTAKVAGTERGVTEPQATFSTCFGAPFMPLPPDVYADLLGERIGEHGGTVWLVNTGWTGGPDGVGHRMTIAYTRAMVAAALNGSLATCRRCDPILASAYRSRAGMRGGLAAEEDVERSGSLRREGSGTGRSLPRKLRPVRRFCQPGSRRRRSPRHPRPPLSVPSLSRKWEGGRRVPWLILPRLHAHRFRSSCCS